MTESPLEKQPTSGPTLSSAEVAAEHGVSVILPAFNEQESITNVVRALHDVLTEARIEHEIVVVNDGSTDETAARVGDAKVISHPQNAGYGRSLKTGILAARYDLVAITDADGTYPVKRLPEMIQLSERFNMIVGARKVSGYQESFAKRFGRFVFRRLSEFAAGQQILDINSGFRVFRRSEILPFFPVISSGFSFTATSTLVYLLNGLFVHYVDIEYERRIGESKVRHFRDGMRSMQIIVEAILRCNPIKIFMLLAMPFVLTGLVLAAVAGLQGNWLCGICSLIAIGFGCMLFAIGCLAVAVMPRLRMVEVLNPVVYSESCGK